MDRLAAAFLMLGAALSSSAAGEPGAATPILFTADGAWCWFQDPRAVYVQGRHERTYAQWMTHEGKLQVGACDHETGRIEIHTLKESWDRDDHNVGAFLVLPDQRLMAFYARHGKQGIFCRTTSQPEDITQWGEEVVVSSATGVTYAHPVYLNAEQKFYVFWRGPSWKPTFATSRDGVQWSTPEILIQDIGKEKHGIRPYMKITSDGKSSIHFAFTDGHPRNEPHNSLYYLRYEKGQFCRADGSLVGDMGSLPIPHRSSDRVYDGTGSQGRAWVWDIALDAQNHPVIAYTRLPAETDHRYCYARWTGAQWLDVEITAGGGWFPQTAEGKREKEPHYSGGMAINHSNPSVLYVSRPIAGVFEIERWETPDQGVTWVSRAITEHSTHLNVRPLVPRGYAGDRDYVLWMSGAYQAYTDYRTGIQLLH